MKKFLSSLLAMAMMFSLSVPAFAASSPHKSRSISDDIPKTSVETIEAIYSNHAVPNVNSTNTISESELSSSEIDNELSHIYLDIYYAKEAYSANPTPENELALATLVDRKNLLEQTMEQRGYIFLTDAEAQALVSDPSGADGTPPPDTENTRYSASPYDYVKLSDGFKVKYFYVTAYAMSPNSNMVREANLIEVSDKNSVIGDFVNSIIETYIGKIIGEVIDLIPGASWFPYEMLTPGASNDLSCSYTIKPTYTTTPRFIWSLSDSLDYYLLDGVTHSTNIEDHHMMVYTENGFSHTEKKDVYYTQTTDGWKYSRDIVKNQWETYAPKPHFEYAENVDYYYQFDENDPDSEKFIASERVPYAISYLDMN